MKHDVKKYTFRIEWSEEDKVHMARCAEFPSLAAHGKTPEKALKEIEFVVAESIKWIEEENGVVPEPLSVRQISPCVYRPKSTAASQRFPLNREFQSTN